MGHFFQFLRNLPQSQKGRLSPPRHPAPSTHWAMKIISRNRLTPVTHWVYSCSNADGLAKSENQRTTMKITTTKRNEFDRRAFMGGFVKPETEIRYGEDPIFRDEIAKGAVICGVWYELPDPSDGEYVLIETLRTNAYGYYENGGSMRELITRDEAHMLCHRVMRGIVNQVAVIRVDGERVDCEFDERELIRRQGV